MKNRGMMPTKAMLRYNDKYWKYCGTNWNYPTLQIMLWI
jgi:hypothetical protein